MAEELYFSIKTDIKSATKDTQEYADSLEGAEKHVSDLNKNLKIQNQVLLEQEKELLKLQRLQDAIPKGAWHASAPKIAEDIKKLTGEIKSEKLALKDLQLQQKSATNTVKEFQEVQKDLGGSLMADIKNYQVMGISINGIGKAFKKIIPAAKAAFATIKTGMISTGIGALVVAFGALVAWFTKTKAGAEMLTKIFAGVGAAVKIFVDRLIAYGKLLFSIITLDFKGMATNAKAAFMGLGDELQREIGLAMELADATHKLADSERALSVETAKKRADIEDYKKIAEDLSLTEAERLEAAEAAFKMENDLLAKRIANAEEAVRIQQQQNTMSDNMAADLDALAEKEIALANIRMESTTKQIELNNKINSIKAATAAKEVAEQHKWIERQNERIRIRNEITKANNKIRQDTRAIREELSQREMKTDEERELRKLFLAKETQKKILEDSKLNKKELGRALKTLDNLFESDTAVIEDKWAKVRKDKQDAEFAAYKSLWIENQVLELTTTGLTIEEKGKLRKTEFDLRKEQLDNELKAFLLVNEEEKRLAKLAVGDAENRAQQIMEIDIKYGQISSNAIQENADKQKAVEEEEIASAKRVAAAKVQLLADTLAVGQKFMDIQSAQIEEDYNKELKLAKANGESTEKIEEKFDEKRIKQAKKMKAMKIAMAIVDTYQSAVAAYANGLTVGGPAGLVLAPIAAGLAVVSGLANVAMIEQQPLGGSAGGGGGGGGGGGRGASPSSGGAPPGPMMMSGAFDLSGGVEPEPLKAFVVTDEMTNSQNQLSNIRRRATI
tara:strand:+ start:5723 stop:8083 length:2361 start_codon:yes stop_codon:yes gene_type:complete